MTPSERTILFYLCDAVEAAPWCAGRLVDIVWQPDGSGLFLNVLNAFRLGDNPVRTVQIVRRLIS